MPRADLVRAAASALVLLAALPAAAQELCPYGGAVVKVQNLPQELIWDNLEAEGIAGRVEGLPDCEITVEAVRAAAATPACRLYAQRPDALALEMVFSCLLEKTGGNPKEGTHIAINALALSQLRTGQ